MGVDLYRYDEKRERDASDALNDFLDVDDAAVDDALRLAPGTAELDGLVPKPGTSVIDLRQAADFARFRLPGSVNLPLVDPCVLKDLWLRLEDAFGSGALVGGKRLLLLCYDGDSAPVDAQNDSLWLRLSCDTPPQPSPVAIAVSAVGSAPV